MALGMAGEIGRYWLGAGEIARGMAGETGLMDGFGE